VWNAHYCDDGVTTLLLANSLWLDEAFSFRQETVDRLAASHRASSFWGDLGTDAMNEQLQAWLNANTGGLLQEQANHIEMDPSTVFTLANTVYFAADWKSEFRPEKTQDMLFHCGEYDLMTPFMYQILAYGTYYRGTNFGATYLELEGENTMWLILPDEGYTVEDILQSDEYWMLTMNPGSWRDRDTYRIHLRLPKFDVVSETNLSEGLKEIGITDVFDPAISDFTTLSDAPGLYVGSASHAARVTIDEEGCLAAAFTVFLVYGTGMSPQPPEMDFTLDRPFMFVISSRDDLPLFVGTVAEP
jgi:serine protease inhibitor